MSKELSGLSNSTEFGTLSDEQGIGGGKMKIYHGSNVVVEHPKILQSERMLDFGVGFYTTSNKEQAIKWSARVAERREPKIQILSVYEFDLEAATCDLAVVRFDKADGEWLDFICANRSGRDIPSTYDIAIGAVADDKVYSVVQFYENGVYDKEYALARMNVEALFDQILFHTERALKYLRFTRHEDLGGTQ